MLIENNDFEQLEDISVIKKENYRVGGGGGVSTLPRNKASQGRRTYQESSGTLYAHIYVLTQLFQQPLFPNKCNKNSTFMTTSYTKRNKAMSMTGSVLGGGDREEFEKGK